MIETTLTKAAADALFTENAIFLYSADAVPEQRIYELFGTEAVNYYDRTQGDFKGGADYNVAGAGTEERPFITYFTKAGFMRFVSEHNYLQVTANAAIFK